MRILHMSDLHFETMRKKAESEEKTAVRGYYLYHILGKIERITREYPVEYVFITGDRIYRALMNRDRQLMHYLKIISEVCGDFVHRIYLCQGTYDMGYEKEEDTYKFHIYETGSEERRVICVSTSDEFDGRNWSERRERIDLGVKKKARRLPAAGFCVMWWMKN